MSCASANSVPARDIFDSAAADDDASPLPSEYYIYTALMILTVLALPFLYQQLWIAIFDVVNHIRLPKHLRGAPRGCRKIGGPGTRDLSRELGAWGSTNGAREVGEDAGEGEPAHGLVQGIFVYPVKSCYPVEVEEIAVTSMGLAHDRQFCFAQFRGSGTDAGVGGEKRVDAADDEAWEFLTQRATPSLTHLKCEIWIPDESLPEDKADAQAVSDGGYLRVSFAYSPPPTSPGNILALLQTKLTTLDFSAKPKWIFDLPLSPNNSEIERRQYAKGTLRIWNDHPHSLDLTSEIPAHILGHLRNFFFADTQRLNPRKAAKLGAPPALRLYRVDPREHRLLFKCAPTKEQLGYQSIIGFQDSYPISIQNLSSIADVEAQIPSSKTYRPDSRRYRANIYVSGPPPYAEDNWTFLTLSRLPFHVSSRTTRCKLPTNDPETGLLAADLQPYSHLQKHRTIDEGAPNHGCLGMMMVPTLEAVGGTLRRGDAVKVRRRGQHFFVGSVAPEAQRPVL